MRRYSAALPGGTEEFDLHQLRDLIRTGIVTAETAIATADGAEWRPAGEHEELRRYLDLASARREKATSTTTSVTPKRLITYLALGGLAAGAIMSILAPICLIFGVFAKFVLSFGAFGAVMGLAINSAVREPNTRLINLSAASFAAGGLVAWAMAGTSQFTPLHLAVIGMIGTAGLVYALGLPIKSALPVVIAAAVMFPVSVLLIPKIIPEGGVNLGRATLLLLPLLIFLPAVPFALFGGVLGGVMSMTGEKA
ncbi:MAG: DUF4339 domain-containing protein [Thermoanaerobaculia bacterium]